MSPTQFSRYALNVHGHLHSKRLEDPRYLCVSVEQIDMRPILFDTLLKTRER